MKTNPRFKKLMLICFGFLVYFISGCTKASVDNVKEPDQGFGCNTSHVIKTITNEPGKLVYSTYLSQWIVSFDLEGIYYITCDICDYGKNIEAVTSGHSTNEIINVIVSGKIKNITINQPPMTSHPGYRDTYLVTIDTIN